MNVCYITFRSVTLAQRGEGVLNRKGIKCYLQRTPRWMEERGCGYCLKLKQQDIPGAVEVLRQNQAAFSKVYRIRDDGQGEEMAL